MRSTRALLAVVCAATARAKKGPVIPTDDSPVQGTHDLLTSVTTYHASAAGARAKNSTSKWKRAMDATGNGVNQKKKRGKKGSNKRGRNTSQRSMHEYTMRSAVKTTSTQRERRRTHWDSKARVRVATTRACRSPAV